MREYAVERWDSQCDTQRFYAGFHPQTIAGQTFDMPAWTWKAGEALTFASEGEARFMADQWGDYYAMKGYGYACTVAIFDDE